MISLDDIAREIKASKKYRVLSLDTISHVLAQEAAKHDSLKNARKSARKKLHLILAAYLCELNYRNAAQEIQAAFGSGEEQRIRGACLGILERHASTRERIPALTDFYDEIFKITGKPARLADLACALNPFSFRWMGLPREIEYHAYDNNSDNIALLNLYFKLEDLAPLAEERDVLCSPAADHCDVGFLFKMYHCLEHRQKGAGWKVVETAPVTWLAVSFPTANLSDRKVDIFSNYKEELLACVESRDWQARLLEFPLELVLLIKKEKLS